MNGIWTHDPRDTGAVLYQLSYQATWELATLHKPTGYQMAWIAEVTGSNPVQAWFFSGFQFIMCITAAVNRVLITGFVERNKKYQKDS